MKIAGKQAKLEVFQDRALDSLEYDQKIEEMEREIEKIKERTKRYYVEQDLADRALEKALKDPRLEKHFKLVRFREEKKYDYKSAFDMLNKQLAAIYVDGPHKRQLKQQILELELSIEQETAKFAEQLDGKSSESEPDPNSNIKIISIGDHDEL
jgi:S-adenosylmethionine synthetase